MPPSERTTPKRRRKKLYRFSMLNVKAHPHGPRTYIDILRAAADLGITVSYLGERVARIGTVTKINDEVLAGEIWLYTKIDATQPIFDLDKKRTLRDEEVQRIDFDWDKRGFHYKKFLYAFAIKEHRLGFDASGLSPNTLRSILQQIFQITIAEMRGIDSVMVEVEQEPTQLEQIYRLKLQRLSIRISRPNPDSLEDLQADFEAALAAQNATSETTVLEGVDLKPNAKTKMKALVATSNGEVEGTGIEPESNRQITKTTREAPVVENRMFDPWNETSLEFVARMVKELAVKVVAGLRKKKREEQ